MHCSFCSFWCIVLHYCTDITVIFHYHTVSMHNTGNHNVVMSAAQCEGNFTVLDVLVCHSVKLYS